MNKRAPKRTDTERLRAALQECADCLEDVASGKGAPRSKQSEGSND
jgi:hypothetical protein